MSTNFQKLSTASQFMRHLESDPKDFNIDTEIDAPIVVAQIDLAEKLAELLTDQLELSDPIQSIDLLDALASLGIVLSSIEEDHHNFNYASLAYFYTLNPALLPEVTDYLL